MRKRLLIRLVVLFFGIVGAPLMLESQCTPAKKKPQEIEGRNRHATKADTLVCVLDWRGGGSEVDPVLPVGGIYEGEWLGGADWGRKLPERAELVVYSLTRGAIGSLQITGASNVLPEFLLRLNRFNGFKGTCQMNVKDESSHPKRYLGNVVAVWRRDDTPVSWAKTKELNREDPKYLKIARDYVLSRGLEEHLVSHGYSKQLTELTKSEQILSVDLDRDGQDEILMSIYWRPPNGSNGIRNRNYLLLVKHGPVEQPVITALANRDSCWSGVLPEKVLGCLDIDGDGKAEVVTSYVEDTPADEFHIYQWKPARRVAHYKIIYGE